jgi:Phosphotransferase enzyme family
MLALGVPDMRPEIMPQRFDEALAGVRGYVAGRDSEADRETYRRMAERREQFASWCKQLAAMPGAPSIDHNDLHPWNILGGARYYDWGDSVVAHPFAAMLVPLGFVQRGLGADLDDPRFTSARDAYLGVFADLAPHEELVETLELACRVAKIARALTWERALRSAREQGEEVEPYFAAAPAETLASLADDSYLGGG